MGYIEENTKILLEILSRGVSDSNDFVSLAITGEELRRAIQIEKKTPVETAETVQQYDEMLPDLCRFVPSGIVDDLFSALEDLSKYASTPISERNWCTGEDLIRGIDGILSVAAASARSGARSKEFVGLLVKETKGFVNQIAHQLEITPETEMIHGWPDECRCRVCEKEII